MIDERTGWEYELIGEQYYPTGRVMRDGRLQPETVDADIETEKDNEQEITLFLFPYDGTAENRSRRSIDFFVCNYYNIDRENARGYGRASEAHGNDLHTRNEESDEALL